MAQQSRFFVLKNIFLLTSLPTSETCLWYNFLMASGIEDRLDAQFSLFVRLSRADHAGFIRCFTCDKAYLWNEVDCGHWQKRGNHGTRWEEDNCRPQCTACNRLLNGLPSVFEEELVEEIGEERLERLRAIARAPVSHTDEELRNMLRHYAAAVDKLGRPQ